jgi:hypothetical protein
MHKRNIHKELEETLSKLKETKDPTTRKELLRKMRILLEDAEGIIEKGLLIP